MDINHLIELYQFHRELVESSEDAHMKSVYSIEMNKLHEELTLYLMKSVYDFIDKDDPAYGSCRIAAANLISIMPRLGDGWGISEYDFHVVFRNCFNEVEVEIDVVVDDDDYNKVVLEIEANYTAGYSESFFYEESAPMIEEPEPLCGEIVRIARVLGVEAKSMMTGSYHMCFDSQIIRKRITS